MGRSGTVACVYSFDPLQTEVVFLSYCGKCNRGASHSQLRSSFPLVESFRSNLEIVHVYSLQTPLPCSTSAAAALCKRRGAHSHILDLLLLICSKV